MGRIRDFLNAFNNSSVLLLVKSRTQPDKATEVSEDEPLPVRVVGSGGSTSDPASARETTLVQVRDAVQALNALLGNTDGIEALLATQATYLDQVGSILTGIGNSTDGLEGLLGQLGVKDDNVLGKLEALRLLLAATLTVQGSVSVSNLPGTQPISAASLPLPTGAASETKLEAVRALLAGTLTVSTGNNDPATGTRQTSGNDLLTAIRNLLQNTLAVSAANLPLPNGAATETKLEAVRALVANLLTNTRFEARVPAPGAALAAASVPVALATDQVVPTSRAAQVTSATTFTIAATTSVSDAFNLTGRTLLRLSIGASWTAADITIQTSPDGTTWADLYDEYGNVYAIKAGANRNIYIAPGPLLAANWVRFRSGTPAAAVAQSSAATLTAISVSL